MASLMTMRSGVMTSRRDTFSRSRSSSCMVRRFSTSRRTSAITDRPGSGTSSTPRASGAAAAMICFSHGKTRSSHQRATSGKDSRRSVSPVGAQSTTITSHASDS